MSRRRTGEKYKRPFIWRNKINKLHIGLSIKSSEFIDECDCDCDCDCACTVETDELMTGKIALHAKGWDASERMRFVIARDTCRITVGEKTAYLSCHTPGITVLDGEASLLLQAMEDHRLYRRLEKRWSTVVLNNALKALVSAGILQAAHARTADPGHSAPAWQPTKLTTWLHLTSRCTMACSYCYVKPVADVMKPEIACAAVQAIFRSAQRHGYRKVKIKYAGGEPSLNFAALQAAQQTAEQQSAASGIALESVILTNGVLLSDEIISYLFQHHIHVMLSMDGLDQAQNGQRPLREVGDASFHLVVASLDRLLAAGIHPLISITLTRLNLDSLPDFIAYLLEKQLHFVLNFYRPAQEETADQLVPEAGELIAALERVYQVIENWLPTFSLLSNLSDRAHLATPHAYTCGVGQNYLVIGCQGEIAKCQMDLEQPVSNIWADDPLEIVQNDRTGLLNLPVQARECRDCPWSSRCTGGCPRLTHQQTQRYEARSPLCTVYQAIIPQIIRLEALRLVRFEQPLSLEE